MPPIAPRSHDKSGTYSRSPIMKFNNQGNCPGPRQGGSPPNEASATRASLCTPRYAIKVRCACTMPGMVRVHVYKHGVWRLYWCRRSNFSAHPPVAGSTIGVPELSPMAYCGDESNASSAMPMASVVTQSSISPALTPVCSTSGFQSAVSWLR